MPQLFYVFPIRYAWLVRRDKQSYHAFLKKPACLTCPSPVWFNVTRKGAIIGKIDDYILDVAKSNNLNIIPLFSNYEPYIGFSKELFHEFITNDAATKNFISELSVLTSKYEFDGINLDFENISKDDEASFIKVLEQIKSTLPEIILSIDVAPAVNIGGTAWDYTFNYAEISQYVDHMIVMAYDFHWSKSCPGPITPLNWLESVVKYTKKYVLREKIVIGLPLYGYDWPKTSYGRGISTIEAERIAKARNIEPSWDQESLEKQFKYYDESGKEHTIFFQTKEANELRLKLLQKMGITGVAYWYWGAAPLNWFEK